MNVQAPAAVELVKVRVLHDGRMSRRDAARYIGVQDKTLANWTLMKKGPRGHRIGGRVFYYKDDVDRFIGGKAA